MTIDLILAPTAKRLTTNGQGRIYSVDTLGTGMSHSPSKIEQDGTRFDQNGTQLKMYELCTFESFYLTVLDLG